MPEAPAAEQQPNGEPPAPPTPVGPAIDDGYSGNQADADDDANYDGGGEGAGDDGADDSASESPPSPPPAPGLPPVLDPLPPTDQEAPAAVSDDAAAWSAAAAFTAFPGSGPLSAIAEESANGGANSAFDGPESTSPGPGPPPGQGPLSRTSPEVGNGDAGGIFDDPTGAPPSPGPLFGQDPVSFSSPRAVYPGAGGVSESSPTAPTGPRTPLGPGALPPTAPRLVNGDGGGVFDDPASASSSLGLPPLALGSFFTIAETAGGGNRSVEDSTRAPTSLLGPPWRTIEFPVRARSDIPAVYASNEGAGRRGAAGVSPVVERLLGPLRNSHNSHVRPPVSLPCH